MDKKVLTNFRYFKNSDDKYFPIVPVVFHYSNRIIDSSALIDSGATISIFRSDVADYLGVNIEKGTEIYLGGVGGHIKGYQHEVQIEVADKKFFCPIVFSREYLVSFNLLGRQEFFERFRITFEEKKNILKLE